MSTWPFKTQSYSSSSSPLHTWLDSRHITMVLNWIFRGFYILCLLNSAILFSLQGYFRAAFCFFYEPLEVEMNLFPILFTIFMRFKGFRRVFMTCFWFYGAVGWSWSEHDARDQILKDTSEIYRPKRLLEHFGK